MVKEEEVEFREAGIRVAPILEQITISVVDIIVEEVEEDDNTKIFYVKYYSYAYNSNRKNIYITEHNN